MRSHGCEVCVMPSADGVWVRQACEGGSSYSRKDWILLTEYRASRIRKSSRHINILFGGTFSALLGDAKLFSKVVEPI